MSFADTVDRLNDWTRKRQAAVNLLMYLCEDGLRAADLESDRTSGHSTVVDEDGLSMPAVTDPTGEAVMKPDRAREQLSEIVRAETRVLVAVHVLYDVRPNSISEAKQILWVYVNHDRPRLRRVEKTVDGAVSVLHRISTELFCSACTHAVQHPCPRHSTLTKADLEQQRKRLGVVTVDRWCVFCHDEPPCTLNPTTVAGNLPTPRLVGRACYDRIRQTGRPPTRQDLDHLARVGKWPRAKETAR